MKIIHSVLALLLMFTCLSASAQFRGGDRRGPPPPPPRHDDRNRDRDHDRDRDDGRRGRDERGGWGRHDRGEDRYRGDRGDRGRPGPDRGGYPVGGRNVCAEAGASVQFQAQQVQYRSALIQQAHQLCGPNPYCRQQQQIDYQNAVNQYNNAERYRMQACR